MTGNSRILITQDLNRTHLRIQALSTVDAIGIFPRNSVFLQLPNYRYLSSDIIVAGNSTNGKLISRNVDPVDLHKFSITIKNEYYLTIVSTGKK